MFLCSDDHKRLGVHGGHQRRVEAFWAEGSILRISQADHSSGWSWIVHDSYRVFWWRLKQPSTRAPWRSRRRSARHTRWTWDIRHTHIVIFLHADVVDISASDTGEEGDPEEAHAAHAGDCRCGEVQEGHLILRFDLVSTLTGQNFFRIQGCCQEGASGQGLMIGFVPFFMSRVKNNQACFSLNYLCRNLTTHHLECGRSILFRRPCVPTYVSLFPQCA